MRSTGPKNGSPGVELLRFLLPRELPVPITDDFKNALASWVSGVCVVTTQTDGLIYGLTVSSFSSLSLDPPLILVCLHNGNRLPSMIQKSGRFGISILARDQEDASNYFARPGREPTAEFTEIEGEWLEQEIPVVKHSLGQLACHHHDSLIRGDHTIVIGEVLQAVARNEADPLLYYRRAYRSVTSG